MIDNTLIEKALSITWKSMEDMEERYVIYANANTEVGIVKYKFSIEKFCYYLLSPEFIEKYCKIHYKEWETYLDTTREILIPAIVCSFAIAIHIYQKWNEKPLSELLIKINY